MGPKSLDFYLFIYRRMQTTLPLSVGHPLKNVTGLARQIALPGEAAPLRFPSFPALERTAVIGFNTPFAYDVEANTSRLIMVARQATYPVWVETPSYVSHSATYPCAGIETGLGGNVQVSTAVGSNLVNWSSGDVSASSLQPGISGTTTNTSSLLSVYPMLGRDSKTGGAEFIYVPRNSKMHVVIFAASTVSAAITIDATMEVWGTPGETYTTFQASLVTVGPGVTGGSTIMLPPGLNAYDGWVRPKQITIQTGGSGITMSRQWYVSIVVTSNTSSLTYTGSASNAGSLSGGTSFVTLNCMAPASQPTEFLNSPMPWYATRVTAAAVLGTNVSQVLNKGGTVLCGRVSPAVINPWKMTTSYVSGLHPAEKAYLPLETGLYTYAPPSTDLVLFTDYTLNTGGGAPIAPLYNLSSDALVNFVFVKASGVAESLALTVSWHMEFRTSSALFQVALSGMTLESLHAAQIVLAEFGFFFENPGHTKLMNKVMSVAKRYGPSLVGLVHPTAGKLAQLGVSTLTKTIKPKLGPSKPSTTTAQKSGMLGKAAKPPSKHAAKKKK